MFTYYSRDVFLAIMGFVVPVSLWAEYCLLFWFKRSQELSVPVCDTARPIDFHAVLVMTIVLDYNTCPVPSLGHLPHALLVLYQDVASLAK